MSRKIIDGHIDLESLYMTELPSFLRNVEVDGEFNCAYNRLKTLKNSPRYATHFYCMANELTSLEGGPTKVADWYDCRWNKLTNLKGAPRIVDGTFICSVNMLDTLEGLPEIIKGSLHIANNSRQFTEKEIRAVCEVIGRVYV